MQPWHRSKGIPKYLRAHHPMAMTQETRRLRKAGLLTSGDVTKELGISYTTLLRLEGKLVKPALRQGKRAMRTFTREQVEHLRASLREATCLGFEPMLLYMEEVAQLAGCHVHTIRRRRGKELPAGRPVAHPRPGWGFTPEEAMQIAAWWKRHQRGRQATQALVLRGTLI